MPSTLDLGLIAVVLISAFLAMVRGFSREILAIFSWGAAAAAAVYFYPLVLPFLSDPSSPVFIGKEAIRPYAAGAAVFFVTLILVSIITIKLSDAILDSSIGALDRSLGFLFGAFRGLLLCACGLGDAGSSATAAAKLKAQEAEQARAAQAGIASQLDAAQQQAGQRRKEIEAATR